MASGFRLRVKATQVAVRRVDGTEEDDFKTWAHTVVAGPSGPVKEAWYAEDAEPSVSNLGKTSVSRLFVVAPASRWLSVGGLWCARSLVVHAAGWSMGIGVWRRWSYRSIAPEVGVCVVCELSGGRVAPHVLSRKRRRSCEGALSGA
jgi:hypothetical protein